MSKGRKILLAVVGLPVLLVGLLVLFLTIYLTDERLLALVEPPLETALNREVTIGSLEVGLLRTFPKVSVGLNELAIHTPDGPDGPRPDLASLKRLWVVVPLMPLLKQTLEVAALEVEEPKVVVEYYADGTSNMTGLMGEEAAAEAPANDTGAPALREINLQRVEVTDGQLAYFDAVGGLYVVEDLDVHLSANLGAVYRLTGTLQAAGVRAEAGGVTYADDWTLSLDLAAAADLVNETLTLERTVLGVEELQLNLQGDVAQWSAPAMQVDLSFDAPEGQVRGFWSLLPEAFTQDLAGVSADGRLAVEGRVQGVLSATAQPAIDVRLTLADGQIQYPAVPAPIEQMQVALHLTNDRLTVERFQAAAAGNTLALQATVANFAQPTLDLSVDANVDLASVARFYPMPPDESLAGRVVADARLRGALDQPERLEGSGTVVLDQVAYSSPVLVQPIRNLTGRLVLAKEQITVEDLRLESGQSDMTFTGALHNYLAFAADPMPADQPPRLTGRVYSRLFNVVEQMSEDTTATGPIEVPPVKMDVAMQADHVDYDGFALTNVQGRLLLENGRFLFEEGQADLFGGVLEAEGAFDLSNPFLPAVSTTLRLKKLPAQEIFKTFETINRYVRLDQFLAGFFNSELTLGVTMNERFEPDLKTARASGLFGMQEGALQGLPLQTNLSSLTGLQALQNLRVQDWAQAFSVAGDRLHIRDLTLKAGEYRLTLNGTQSLDGGIDYQFSLTLPPGASRQLQGAPIQQALAPVLQATNTSLGDTSGPVVLDFTAGGTFSNPQIKLNTEVLTSRLHAQADALIAGARAEAQARLDSLEAAARARAEAERAAAEQAARDLVEEKKDALEEQARGLVQGQIDSTGLVPSTNVDSLANRAKDEVKDRLRGILGGRKKKNDNQ